MNALDLSIPIISLSVGIIPLFFVKRNFYLLILALGAYFVAIFSKQIIQLSFLGFFLTPSLPTYLAYGLQTAILETGFAYLFLHFKKNLPKDISYGFSYGVYLAFFENAILLGILYLPLYINNTFGLPSNLPLDTIVLSYLLPHFLDRVSSLIFHTYIGFMSFLAISTNKIAYFLLAMPFGMIDSLTAWWDLNHKPISYLEFAIIIFIINIISIFIMLYAKNAQNRV